MTILRKLLNRNKNTFDQTHLSFRSFIAFLDPKSIELLLKKIPPEKKVIEHASYLTLSFVGVFLTVLEKYLLVFKDSFEKNGQPWLFDYEKIFLETLCYTFFVQMSFYLYLQREYIVKDQTKHSKIPGKDYFEFLTTVMGRTSFHCDFHFTKQNIDFDSEIFLRRVEEYSMVMFDGQDHVRHFESVILERLNTDKFGNFKLPQKGYESGQIIALQLAGSALNIGEFDGIIAGCWRDFEN